MRSWNQRIFAFVWGIYFSHTLSDTTRQSYASKIWLWCMKTCQTFKCIQETLEWIIAFWNGEYAGTLIWTSADYHTSVTEYRLNSKTICLLIFPKHRHLLFTKPQNKGFCGRARQFVIVRPRLWLPCEESSRVHGSPLAAVLHCLFKLLSLKKKVYLREEERRDTVGSRSISTASLYQSFFHCPVAKPRVVSCLAFSFSDFNLIF